MTSWRNVIKSLAADAENSGLPSLSGDLIQLNGLCDQMDAEGFFPFTSRDLSPQIGKSVQQLADIVDEVVSTLVTNHAASTKNLSTVGWQSTYGRFFHLLDFGCFFLILPFDLVKN